MGLGSLDEGAVGEPVLGVGFCSLLDWRPLTGGAIALSVTLWLLWAVCPLPLYAGCLCLGLFLGLFCCLAVFSGLFWCCLGTE